MPCATFSTRAPCAHTASVATIRASRTRRKETAIYARIGTWQGTPEELEEWVTRAREHVKPSVAQDAGLTAAYWLVDRAGGKGLIVTIWESEAAMQASEQARARRQAATSAATRARVTTDRYEVIDSIVR